jgi:hypothetical protein
MHRNLVPPIRQTIQKSAKPKPLETMNETHLLNAPQNVNDIPEPVGVLQEKYSRTAGIASPTLDALKEYG